LVARAIHQQSCRVAAPFVPVDCGAVQPTLIESELFGHEKGAFTGADRTRPGKFEAAAGGTLFLDEIQNLPLAVQTKLLRALQERQICHVGGTNYLNIDLRVIAATNQDLAALVEARRFRQDLYHRLNEFSIVVPPLRERREDIFYLAHRFYRLTCVELRKNLAGISDQALELLSAYRWPGNVRELRNVIRRAVLLADTRVEPEHLDIRGMPPRPKDNNGTSVNDSPVLQVGDCDGSVSLKEILRQNVMRTEREILIRALRRTGGNKAEAARLLQIDYKTIRTKTRQYGICLIGKGENKHGQQEVKQGV
jgi:two-component system nitrogen regulation response regulator GlnG